MQAMQLFFTNLYKDRCAQLHAVNA